MKAFEKWYNERYKGDPQPSTSFELAAFKAGMLAAAAIADEEIFAYSLDSELRRKVVEALRQATEDYHH